MKEKSNKDQQSPVKSAANGIGQDPSTHSTAICSDAAQPQPIEQTKIAENEHPNDLAQSADNFETNDEPLNLSLRKDNDTIIDLTSGALDLSMKK